MTNNMNNIDLRSIEKMEKLVGKMRVDPKNLKFIDCWWNQIIRKILDKRYGVVPELIMMFMLDKEILRRENA